MKGGKEPKPYWSYEWLETELVTKRRTLKDIGDECGVTKEAIRQSANRLGLYKPPLYLTLDKTWLKHEYIDLRRNQRSMAAEIGVGRLAISKALKLYGIVRIPFTKEENQSRRSTYHKHRYATDQEFRTRKMSHATSWRKSHVEENKVYHQDYYQKNLAKGRENEEVQA